MNLTTNSKRNRAIILTLSALSFVVLCISSLITGASSQAQVTSANQGSANGPSDSPVGWRASYTQIYFDDVESLQPTVGPQFLLDSAGVLTSTPGEVISGTRSVKGSNTGSGSFTPYLRTNPSVLSFTPSQTYRVTFTYRILVAPDRGFECLLYSPTGAAAGNFLPSINVNGPIGATGTATLTNTLGTYADYEARWNVIGTGAIAIDDIRIEQLPGQTVATEDGEGAAPSISQGLRLNGSANVTTDPNQVVGGAASVKLTNFGNLETNPAVLPLLPNTYYTVEFRYRIINRGTDANNNVAFVNLQPADSSDPALGVYSGGLLKNAEATGSFSTGALTANAATYVLRVYAAQNALIIVDDIRLRRIDPVQISSQPAEWTALGTRPFPRLGNYQQNSTNGIVEISPGEGSPFAYTANQMEDRLAFADVIAGEGVNAQTIDSDFVRRMRLRNPNIVILPYRISEEHGIIPSQYSPTNSSVDLEWQFQSVLDSSWFAQDTHSNQISEVEPEFAFIKIMDISPFCPVVNNKTFLSYEND